MSLRLTPVFRALTTAADSRRYAGRRASARLGFGPLTGAAGRVAAGFSVGALALCVAAPAALAQGRQAPPPDCRNARGAVRDMGLRAVEAQTLREACGIRESDVQAEATRLEEQVLGLLARIAPDWPNDAVRTDFARVRAALRRQYRTDTSSPIRPDSCGREETRQQRLTRLAEARQVLEAEQRPGGSLACTPR